MPDTCPICLDDLGGTREEHTLACGHSCHSVCIIGWLKQDQGRSCPVCRKEDKVAGISFLTERARKKWMLAYSRKKDAPRELKRLVKSLRKKQAAAKKARKEHIDLKAKHEDTLKLVGKAGSRRWRLDRSVRETERVIGCFSVDGHALPGLLID